MSVRDFLQRFRPAGAPGAAARSGVPADRVAELEAELAPVFVALAATEAEAAALRQEAAEEADQIRADAKRAADATVTEARMRADAVRQAAFAAARAEAAGAGRDAVAAAEREVLRIQERVVDRSDGLVTLAVDGVLATLGLPRRAGAP